MVAALDKPIVCPVLVGREDEVAALARCLDEARAGAGQVVLVTGEAGIGKSRLVAEAAARARAAGFTVLTGHCFAQDRGVPYAPLVDLLRSCCAERSVEEVAAAVAGVPELAILLPELAAFLPEAPAGLPAAGAFLDKHRLFLALRLAVLRCTAGAPALLVVEDAHWADETSLEWLHLMARWIADQPVLLVITHRADEVSPALAHLLAELDRGRLAAELRLPRLSTAHVATMLRASLDLQDHGLFSRHPLGRADFAALIYGQTEGNPFFVEEVLRALVAAGEIRRTAHGWEQRAVGEARAHLPRSVEDAVQRRLDRLSEEARHTLTLAAVAGQRVEFALLLDLCDCDEATLLTQVKELIAAGLIVEEADDRFAFRHALTRQAVEAGLLERERRRLHGAIGVALERLAGDAPGARVDDLARHFFAAHEWAKALPYARRAGQRAADMYAPAVAAEHLTRAMHAARELALAPDVELLRARGMAYETLGRFDEAQADHEAARRLAEAAGDRRGAWQAWHDLGCLWTGRDYGTAGEAFQRALDLARQTGDSALVAHSLNRIGNWHVNVEQPHEALTCHQEALAGFEALGDRPGIAETCDLLGMAHALAGDAVGTVVHLRRAVALFRELDHRRGLASSLVPMAFAAANEETHVLVPGLSSLAEGDAFVEDALRIAREIGWRAGEAFALCGYGGMSLTAQGRYSRALAASEEALAVAEEIGHRQWQCFAHCAVGLVHSHLYSLDAARQHLECSLRLAHEVRSVYWTRVVSGFLGQVAVSQGDIAGARAVLDAVLKEDPPPETSALRVAWCGRAELALAERDPALAFAIADRLTATTANAAEGRVAPRVAELRGRALAALGRLDDAETDFRAALAMTESQGARAMAWRLLAALGRLKRTLGRPDEAARAFAAARDIVAILVAEAPEGFRDGFLAGAAKLLPPGPAPSARQAAKEAFAGLTEREREVAALLTAGRSNRQIGEALFVSEWTVATHVRNILAKLDFSSRTQIAAWARDHGLGDGCP